MTRFDYLLISFLLLLPLLAGPMVQVVAGSSKTIRYVLTMITLVTLGSGAVLVWISAGRPIQDLGLDSGVDVGFLAAIGLALFVVLYLARAVHRLGDAEVAARARSRLRTVAGMLPVSRSELIWFIALGVVAGTVEETVYRGYLLLGLAPGGPLPALILSAVAFGVAHLYQGWAGAGSTVLFGLALGVLTLLAGSIIPAVAIHVTQDVAAGLTNYRLKSAPVTAG